MTRRSCLRLAPYFSTILLRGQAQPSLIVPAAQASSTISYSLVGQRVPLWSRGSLIIVEGGFDKTERDSSGSARSPRLRLFDRQDREILNAPFTAPGASNVYIYDWTRAKDGSVVACGTILHADKSQHPFIAWITAPGQIRMVHLSPYAPYRVAAAEDGTVWTVGYEAVNGAETGEGVKVDANAGVIRRFDAAGKQLRSFVPQSGISDVMRVRSGLLQPSRDRIGWYSSGKDDKGRYVEVSNDGSVANYPLVDASAGRRLNGFALTEANAAVVAITGEDGRLSVHLLDRRTRQWLRVRQPESLAAAKGIRLWGAEGNELVFGMPERGKIALRFFSLAL